jgi:hypothetical protein
MTSGPSARAWGLPALLGAALVVRGVAVVLSDRVVVDLLRYRKVAAHLLDVSWNPYLAARLYPYPPVWMWVEAAAEWVSRHTGMSFAVLVRVPVVAGDLALVAVLDAWGRERGGAARWAGWLYALHPVSVLVSGFHGQFDALALLPAVLALRAHQAGRLDASALWLAAAIAVKSFPVLLLPFLVLAPLANGGRASLPQATRYVALALAPVAVLLAPFAWADPGALRRELFGYGGVADFGWIGAWRGLGFLRTGTLLRAEAAHWTVLVGVGKVLLLAALGGLAVGCWRRPRRDLAQVALMVFLAFGVFYGAVSAQYLLWPVPFGVLRPGRLLAAHTLAASLGLAGFYLFLAPGVLTAGAAVPGAGSLWVAGSAAVVAVSLAWLIAEVRRPA